MDRFDAMRTFLAVCDAGGFAAAARRLKRSPSVVTRAVAGLEARLGVRLLQRTTRTVRLSEAGTRFLERARRILAEVEEAEASAQQERAQPTGRLVVAAPLLFGRLHVAPLLSTLLEAHPTLSAELQLSDRLVNLVEEGVDVALRIGSLLDSSLVAHRLGRTRRVLVASPRYLERSGGPPAHPSELRRHALVAFSSLTPGPFWTFHDAKGAPFSVEVQPRFATNGGDTALDYAVQGGGITAAFRYQVEASLRAGALVEVLAGFAPPPVSIQAVFPSSRLLSGKVRAFLSVAERVAPTWQFLEK